MGFHLLRTSFPVSDQSPTMPSAIYDEQPSSVFGGNVLAKTRCENPLRYGGSLDGWSHIDLTPVIGREFEGLQVAHILSAQNRDELIKDLAVTGGRRT